MPKKLIALKGAPNTGKSATMRKMYELLKSKYPQAVIISEKIYTVDITVILKIDNNKIGIESQGDPNGHLGERKLILFRLTELQFDHLCYKDTRDDGRCGYQYTETRL